jgi:hypothetical protein
MHHLGCFAWGERTWILTLLALVVIRSQVWVLPQDRKVFRGLGGLLLPSKFWEADAYGCKGGEQPEEEMDRVRGLGFRVSL